MNIRQMPRTLLVMTLAMIIANVASQMYSPFMPLYLESLGATVQQVGLFFTLSTVMAILCRVLGGWISDHQGRLLTIAIGGVVGLGAVLGYTLAPTWGWAMIGGALAMMGGSLVGPSFRAFIAESAPEDAVGSTYGLIDGLFLTCQIVGPLAGGFLVERFGYKPMLWAALGVFTTATVMRLWMARGARWQWRAMNPASLAHDLRSLLVLLLGGGLVTWLFVVDGLGDAGMQTLLPFLPKYVTEVAGQSETTYGGLFALTSVVTALTMWAGGNLADRYGERWGIALGGLVGVSALLIWIAAPTLPGIVVGVVLFGLSTSLVQPAFSSLLSQTVPRESLGVTLGLFWSALGVLAVPAPYLGGLLYDTVAPQAPFWVAAALLLLTIPVAIWKLRRPARTTPEAAGGH